MNQILPKILIVDDKPANIAGLRTILARPPAAILKALSRNQTSTLYGTDQNPDFLLYTLAKSSAAHCGPQGGRVHGGQASLAAVRSVKLADRSPLYRQHDFAVILIDVNIPGISDDEIAEPLQASDHAKQNPDLFLSHFSLGMKNREWEIFRKFFHAIY